VRSHFFRHVISRPHVVQGLVGSVATRGVRGMRRGGCLGRRGASGIVLGRF
jgi:hypothetical protein